VLTPRVTERSLFRRSDLLVIARFGVGYDSVDVDACTDADVVLTIATGAVDRSVAEATLTWNDNGRYTARWVHLAATGSSSVFLEGIDSIELPVAHAEGKIVVRNDAVLSRWREKRQIALCYDPQDNPNGSMADIAGLADPTGRVLGLMPHPERHMHATQHPQWTRRRLDGEEGAGMQIFRNAVEYFG
jgi:phosphoribosylformylglycinamidine synthase